MKYWITFLIVLLAMPIFAIAYTTAIIYLVMTVAYKKAESAMIELGADV